MVHSTYRRLLARRDELPLRERARLARHLERCADCRQRLAAYDRQDRLLGTLGSTPPDPAVRSAVLNRISLGEHHLPAGQQRPWLSHPWDTRTRFLPSVALAAVLVVLALAETVRHGGFAPHSTPPRNEQASLCRSVDEGWSVQGDCHVVSSLQAFRGPGVVVLQGSVQLTRQNLRHPTYVVHHGFLPIVVSDRAKDIVYYTELAVDQKDGSRLYAIGRAS